MGDVDRQRCLVFLLTLALRPAVGGGAVDNGLVDLFETVVDILVFGALALVEAIRRWQRWSL